MIVKDISIKLQKEKIFSMLQYEKGNPFWEELEKEYDTIEGKVQACLEPKAIITLCDMPQEFVARGFTRTDKVIFAMMTIGAKSSRFVAELSKQGAYLASMLADTSFDYALFQIDTFLRPFIIELAQKEKLGIAERIEPPNRVGMEGQKIIHSILQADKRMGISINEHFVYTPLKTISQIYLLSENTEKFELEHNCRNCQNKNCTFQRGGKSENHNY